MWLSTSHPEHGPHQVPLWFLWDGRAVWMCTGAASPTARNVRAEPRVRLALPDAFDVVLLQGEAECFPDQEVPRRRRGRSPTGSAGIRAGEDSFLYLRVVPGTVRAWHGEPELRGRVVMRDGNWLE